MKWSYSAHNTMRRCQRQFAFGQIVASATARDERRREVYILKQLQDLSAWQGSVVHATLGTKFLAALRDGRSISPRALTAAAQDLARRQFAFSAAKRYREAGRTKGASGDEYCALVAHERGEAVPPDALTRIHATIERCFHHLAGQREFLTRLYGGSDFLAEARLSFPFAGASVAATLDLVARQPGGVTVVDWKIAASETRDYRKQLLVYALAVARDGRWPGLTAADIELYEANLLKDEIRRHPLDDSDLEEAEDFVFRSVTECRALVGDDKYDDLDLDEFEVAERPTTCRYCRFTVPCIEQLAAAGRPEEAVIVQGRLF